MDRSDGTTGVFFEALDGVALRRQGPNRPRPVGLTAVKETVVIRSKRP